jgi:hypothetical protein
MTWAAMSSTNYYVYSDTLDFGGEVSSSTSNNLQDSIGGDLAEGNSSSTSYQVKAGYQAAEIGTITLDLSSNSISFGTLSASTLVTSSLVATVDTNSETGYTMSISAVSGSLLSAVTDGTVDGSGSSEEYGLAVSGADAAYANDVAVASSLVLASNSGAVSSKQTTLIFKAIRASNTTAGAYSQSITLTAVVN